MIELTEAQRQTVLKKAGGPIEVIDTDTQRAYVLFAREQYEWMRSLVGSEREPSQSGAEVTPGILPEILPSQQAYWRDLPQLLSQPKMRDRWVCYHGDERFGIGNYDSLVRECVRRGIPDDAFYFGGSSLTTLRLGNQRTSSRSATTIW